MNIIGRRKIFYFLSGVIILSSIIAVFLFGFRFGIDFVGGTFWEVRFANNVSENEVRAVLEGSDIRDVFLQAGDEGTLRLRFREIDEETHQRVFAQLKEKWPDAEDLRFETVGPTIGETLRKKAIQAILLVILGISFFIAWAFRKVSQPVASWKYGMVTVFTLFHDVIVPIGLFAFLGRFHGVEIDSNFVVALLVVMGFSVHDTIVVFDRIRENLRRYAEAPFEEVVNKSVNETLSRSVNTSFTTLLALAALLLWGSGSLHSFVLAMMVGILVGTYSSIFIASPLLVDWHLLALRKRGKS
jgi:preprotein translocase subunit SecF